MPAYSSSCRGGAAAGGGRGGGGGGPGERRGGVKPTVSKGGRNENKSSCSFSDIYFSE